MYEKFFADVNARFKPALELFEINSSTAQKMAQQQSAYFSELVESSLAHSKALAGSKDFAAAAELQQAYFAELGQNLMDLAKQNLDLVVEAKDALSKVMEASFEGVQSQRAPAAKAAPAAKPAAPKKAAA